MVVVVELVDTLDGDSRNCGIVPRRSPQFFSQVVLQPLRVHGSKGLAPFTHVTNESWFISYSMENTTMNDDTTDTKCGCTKRIDALEKELKDLKKAFEDLNNMYNSHITDLHIKQN